jgi:ribonuclease VapC
MVIDTSALLAILFAEPESEVLAAAILGAGDRYLASPSYVEAVAVVRARRGPEGVVALDALLHELGIQLTEFSVDAGKRAADAYCRYGKGVGSPAVLNLGDCFSYGLATALDQPLLFTGDDFSRTDIESALS